MAHGGRHRAEITVAITFLLLTPATIAQLRPGPVKPSEPLQDQYIYPGYVWSENADTKLVKTDRTGTGVAYACDVGRAIKTENFGTYENQPIRGLEMKAYPRLVTVNNAGEATSHGRLVFINGEDVLEEYGPYGLTDKSTGGWKGDLFVRWENADSQVKIEGVGKSIDDNLPAIEFDLLSQYGFYYRDDSSLLFLSSCVRRQVADLPVYESGDYIR